MTNNKYYFENFIMNCCKSEEYNLRKFLKRILIKNGFSIIEDNYKGRRGTKYDSVHNMLAIRGNPKVCLVAHTDVCRDHGFGGWYGGNSGGTQNVQPVIKEMNIGGEIKQIIQDKTCQTQVGGDDRLGVAINTWIATNTGYDMGLLFTTDEEVGLLSAGEVDFPELMNFELLVQVDRGNHSNQLVNRIGGTELCSYETALKLLQISENIGIPRYCVNGMATDVVSIKGRGRCNEAVNMTCGYHNSIGADTDEYIDIQEAKDTMKYVANIIKYYELENDLEEFKISFKSELKEDEELFSEEKYYQDKQYDFNL